MQKSTSSALSEKKGDKKLPNVFGEKQKKKKMVVLPYLTNLKLYLESLMLSISIILPCNAVKK